MIDPMELDAPRLAKVSVRAAWYAGPNPRYGWVDDWVCRRAIQWLNDQGWDLMDDEFGMDPEVQGMVEIVGEPERFGDYMLVTVWLLGPAFHEQAGYAVGDWPVW